MMNENDGIVKDLLKKIIQLILRNYVYYVRKWVLFYQNEKDIQDGYQRIVNKGYGVSINGKIFISHPKMLILGNNVHLGNNAFLYTDGGLTIGDNTHISRNVVVYTSNHRYTGQALPYDDKRIYKPVHIGKNVWIGMNALIIPGVSIGDGAIIGMGSVVSKNVENGCIVGSSPQKSLKKRDLIHFQQLMERKSFSGPNGFLLSDSQKSFFLRSAYSLGENLFFIVGTGRSGTNSIAEILSQHPEIFCRHEPKGALIRLSTEYAHGKKTKQEVKDELYLMYDTAGTVCNGLYGESDQKLSNLIEIFHEQFPEAKFIWLLRKADDFVASSYARGWFDDREFGYPYRKDISVEKIHCDRFFSDFRLNGYKIGQFLENEWIKTTPFERNCWYWGYWNELIEKQLENIPSSQKMVIHLENLRTDMLRVTSFLNICSFDFVIKKNNLAKYQHYEEWTDKDRLVYQKYCGKGMKKWYGER
jgi:acetyltransferase-like isoleucine patch superfamily enzyme